MKASSLIYHKFQELIENQNSSWQNKIIIVLTECSLFLPKIFFNIESKFTFPTWWKNRWKSPAGVITGIHGGVVISKWYRQSIEE